MPAAGHLPDRLRLVRRPVVRRVEVALAVLPVLAVDEEHRRGGDPTDEVLQALRRHFVAKERHPRGERDRCRDLEPLVAPRHVEVLADRAFTGAFGHHGSEPGRLGGGFEHHLASHREADAADPVLLDVRPVPEEAHRCCDVLMTSPAERVRISFAFTFAAPVEEQDAVTMSGEDARRPLSALAARKGDHGGAVLRGDVPTAQA